MISNQLLQVICTSTLIGLASAKSSKVVPQDLQAAFASSGQDFQVSYTNDAVNGFTDGTQFSTQDVSKAPTFALGDSSGIVASARYTIALVDTTCDNVRTLHFAQSNFKYNFDITNLETDSKPLLDYQAPGSFQETGDRQFSFLLYTQSGKAAVNSLKLPDQGKAFDVKQFQTDNSFKDPDGGVGMVVKLGGQANCNSAAGGGSGGSGQGQSSAAPAQSSVAPSAAQSSVAQSPTAPAPTNKPAAPNSPASSAVVPSAAASSAAARASATVVQPSSAGSPQIALSTSVTSIGEDKPTPSGGSAESTGLAEASNGVQSGAAPLSTVFQTSTVRGGGAGGAGASGGQSAAASGTSTGQPALQSTSDASSMSLMTARCVVVAAMLMFAGLLMQ